MMIDKKAPGIHTRRLRQLLHKMIGIYSPSGKEEEILEFLGNYLKRHHLPVLYQQVDVHRYNLLVLPPAVDPSLVLMGHVDTVVAYDFEHFEFEERGDQIIGLGSADMKGGCAAMIEAYVSLWESGTRDIPVALALVVGEEEDGDGAKKLIREFHFPWAVIGEPTDLRPCMSDYGYIEVQITTRGRRIHASLANPGQNPIENMLRLLLKLSRYIETERPELIYNIRDLSSSKSGFAVPDRCDAWLDIHLPPGMPLGQIITEVEAILADERLDHPDFNHSLRFATIHSGYELPEKGMVVEVLKEIYARHSLSWAPQPFRSHSDANLLWAAGVKPILLGPGQLERAHTPDESISFQQVASAAQIYLDLMNALRTS